MVENCGKQNNSHITKEVHVSISWNLLMRSLTWQKRHRRHDQIKTPEIGRLS